MARTKSDRTIPHGSPFDRGSADSYYRRPPKPHKYDGFKRTEDLTEDEVKEYHRGFNWNEACGDHKEFL